MSPFPVDLDAEVGEETTEVDDAAKETQVRMEAVARAARCEKVSACENTQHALLQPSQMYFA